MFDVSQCEEVQKGIYRIDPPIRVNEQEWMRDEANSGWSAITEKSDNMFEEADIIYVAKNLSYTLNDFSVKLGIKNGKRYGLIHGLPDYEFSYLGGVF